MRYGHIVGSSVFTVLYFSLFNQILVLRDPSTDLHEILYGDLKLL